MSERVAVVTGANRGIGLEICRQLSQQGLKVVLTSRDEQKGKAAQAQLKTDGVNVDYCPLDVTDETSIRCLADHMEKAFGRCDVLVNNAGVFPDVKKDDEKGFPSVFDSSPDVVRSAMETNVYGPLRLCQTLVPLMKRNHYGRIVNMSSGMGQLSEMNGGCPGYRISKTAINALTRILHDELQGENILVNSMCPGWVKTEMGGPHATRDVREGADTAVWLALLNDNGPSGKFFRDRQERPW